MGVTAIRTKCLKCGMTVRATDSDSWQNVTIEILVTWETVWVHGRNTRKCREGGTHNPEGY